MPRLPDSETAAKAVPLGATTLSLAELARQEGSPYVLLATDHFVVIQRP